MKNQNQAKTLSLFEQLPDVDLARTLMPKDAKADDQAFANEQKRKSKRKQHVPLAKAPATGPACLRCVNWMPPQDDDEFGECRELVRIAEDVLWANVSVGTITGRDTARKDWHVQYDYLRTGEAFRCSAYKRAVDVEAA